jgi:HK97 family phage portal protein
VVSLLGALTPRPRNDSPAPLVSRAAARSVGGFFTRRDAASQLGTMATNGTVYGIVNRTSTAVAKTEWHLYRKAKSGKDEDRVEVTSHAALDLINKPNPFMSRMALFEILQQHLDLAGEACLLVSRHTNRALRGLPLELWPIRPDRIDPVPHPTKYLAGWIYTSPDGEKVPLETDEVIHVRMPNPLDPYRGLGPVQSVLTEVVSADYAARWNANFFRDSAEPGGIIEVEHELDDDEFDKLTARWDEQHRGVSRAHRVAILEAGMKWVDRKYTMRDMQFVELRGASRDAVMEAFGFPKPMLGITEDANRASSIVGETVFAKWLTVPRDDRWRDTLNGILLPMYPTGPDHEFDYDSPVPADEEAENADRNSRATAVAALVNVGFDGQSAAEAYELPEGLVWTKPTAPPAQPPAQDDSGPDGPTPPEPEPPAPTPPQNQYADLFAGLFRRAVRNADEEWPESDEDAVDAVDLGPVQAAWEAALSVLLETWTASVVAEWIRQLVEAIKAALGADGDRGDLNTLTVDTEPAASALSAAMAAFAETAAGHAVDEAAAAGVDLEAHWPTAADLEAAAKQVADFEGARYALTAGREAARVAGPDPDADVVGDHVDQFLTELSDAGARQALGGALTDAQNLARAETFAAGPTGALYASEQMDSNTCLPCRTVHGRWICNTDDLAPLFALYPAGGYVDCLGRWRCRGTFVGVWRPETTEGGK